MDRQGSVREQLLQRSVMWLAEKWIVKE